MKKESLCFYELAPGEALLGHDLINRKGGEQDFCQLRGRKPSEVFHRTKQ